VMSVSVCVSVCENVSGTTRPIIVEFLRMLLIAVVRSSSGCVAIHNVLPVI